MAQSFMAFADEKQVLSMGAMFDGSHLVPQDLVSLRLDVPLGYSGLETEWTNEDEFKHRYRPETGFRYNLNVEVIGSERGTFLSALAGRTDDDTGYLIRYSLKILSAQLAENTAQDADAKTSK